MNNNEWKPYGNNIHVLPESKQKVIGDTSQYFLYGLVESVGSEVKNIEPGDMISYTLWGIKDVVMADGTKRYIIQDNPDFILEVKKKNG